MFDDEYRFYPAPKTIGDSLLDVVVFGGVGSIFVLALIAVFS